MTVSCAQRSTGINGPTLATETSIEAALRDGRVAEARDIALGHERRDPGPVSWSLLGRALWRLGDLDAAEEFHRRAAGDGNYEGRLGLARALATRGEYAEALEMARPTLEIEEIADRAAWFVGGLYWRIGEADAAADTFERGAARATGENAARLAALAQVVREADGQGQAIEWAGRVSQTPTELVDGATWVLAEIDGSQALLRFDPMRWRSSVTPEFAARVGGQVAARELARPMRIAGLAATRVPLAVIDTAGGDGVLGFDLLVDLRWLWSPASGELLLGTAGSRSEEVGFQRALARTHWVGIRTILDGLALQLVLVPRIGARPEVASIAPDGVARISPEAAHRVLRNGDPVVGEELRLLTRVGGWQSEFNYRVVPETASTGQVPLPAPVTLGAEFALNWIWRWLPGSRQMALIESLPEDSTS